MRALVCFTAMVPAMMAVAKTGPLGVCRSEWGEEGRERGGGGMEEGGDVGGEEDEGAGDGCASGDGLAGHVDHRRPAISGDVREGRRGRGWERWWECRCG